MPTVEPFPASGYRFIVHQFQYSGGVAAEPGYRIERARFASPLPLAEGFDAIEAYLAGIGRPPTAFCACELRSLAQFTDAGFVAFNRHYVERLAAWGIFRNEVNPVARSNVCPEIDPPATPSFYAFSYTFSCSTMSADVPVRNPSAFTASSMRGSRWRRSAWGRASLRSARRSARVSAATSRISSHSPRSIRRLAHTVRAALG